MRSECCVQEVGVDSEIANDAARHRSGFLWLFLAKPAGPATYSKKKGGTWLPHSKTPNLLQLRTFRCGRAPSRIRGCRNQFLRHVVARRAMNKTLPIDSYRPYLTLLARTHLDQRYQRRIDASDVVQQTLMEAHEKRDQYRGDSSNELAGWLRQMLVHNVSDAVRALRRDKRDIRREQPLEAAVEDSFCRVHDWLAAEQSSASQRMMRDEQLLTLSAAVTRLSDDQREAVILHHLQGYSLKQLAAHLQRSESAVAGLLHRGLRNLRSIIAEQGEEPT